MTKFTLRSIAKVRRKRKQKESMIKKEGKERELRKIIFWMPKLEVKIGEKIEDVQGEAFEGAGRKCGD